MNNDELKNIYYKVKVNDKLSEIRRNIIAKSRSETIAMISIIAIIVALFSLFIFGLLSYRNKDYIAFALSVFLGILLIFAVIKCVGKYKNKSHTAVEQEEEYRRIYAKEVMDPLIKLINKSLEYHCEEKMPIESYRNAKFNEKFTNVSSKDSIHGYLYEKDIKISDIYVTDENLYNSTRYRISFIGTFSVTKFEKFDDLELYIIRKNNTYKNTYNNCSKYESNDLPKEFIDMFDIYTNDDEFVNDNLKPALIQKITNYGAKNRFDISIRKNSINIRVHGKRLLRPNFLAKELISEKRFYAIYDIIKLLVDLSESLTIFFN